MIARLVAALEKELSHSTDGIEVAGETRFNRQESRRSQREKDCGEIGKGRILRMMVMNRKEEWASYELWLAMEGGSLCLSGGSGGDSETWQGSTERGTEEV